MRPAHRSQGHMRSHDWSTWGTGDDLRPLVIFPCSRVRAETFSRSTRSLLLPPAGREVCGRGARIARNFGKLLLHTQRLRTSIFWHLQASIRGAKSAKTAQNNTAALIVFLSRYSSPFLARVYFLPFSTKAYFLYTAASTY